MSELDRLANMAEIFSAVVVIGGILFAVLQVRQIRQQRRELAAIELFRFFGSPQFSESYRAVLHLPDGLNANELERRFPGIELHAMFISTTMENIGVMMHQRIVPSSVVQKLIGYSTVVMWQKLALWAADLRHELESPQAFEWFQWLAERMQELDDGRPAYEAHREWKPQNLSAEL